MRILFSLLAACAAFHVAAQTGGDEETVIAFLKSNCYTCHDPQAAQDNRVAPPMIGVKRHYLDAGYDREQFIEAIATFVAEPAADKTLMPGAVRRFGLMPRLFYDDLAVRQLAAYIHDNDIEQPAWFEAHYRNGTERRDSVDMSAAMSPADRGRAIANATKAQLGKKLMGALNTGDAEQAVSFCNENAIPITSAMEAAHDVRIRRVTDRPRNVANAADAAESAYIAGFQTSVDLGEPIQPLVTMQGTKTTAYLPIVTNAMCLQCHGTPGGTIQPQTLARIQTLYPDDKAIGYGENQVRGIWRVRWEN